MSLCRRALSLLPRTQNEQLWVALNMELGDSLAQLPTGDQGENIEQAIAAYRAALEVRTHAAMPVGWAQTMSNLALAYTKRIEGDRAENIEQAIGAYQAALQVFTRAAMPVEWAETMDSLAAVEANRSQSS